MLSRFFLLLVLAVALSGCVQRTITVTSEPPGALVHLNDEEIGRTPVTVPFTYHGVYDVRLTLDGHQPLWTKHATRDPWYEKPGPDLVHEMIPGAKVEEKWHFTLAPLQNQTPEALTDRARQMRALTQQPPRD